MKLHPVGCIDWRILVISFVVALAWACATLPPPQPIGDFKQIAGTWEGTVCSTLGQVCSPIVTIYREDGTGESIVPQDSPFFRYGDQGHFFLTNELIEGKIRYKGKTTGNSGITTLYEGGGKRVLIAISDDGKTKAEYKPAQK